MKKPKENIIMSSWETDLIFPISFCGTSGASAVLAIPRLLSQDSRFDIGRRKALDEG